MKKEELERYRKLVGNEEAMDEAIVSYFNPNRKDTTMKTQTTTKTPEGYLGTTSQQIIDLDPAYIRIQDGFNYKAISEARVQGLLLSFKTIGYLSSEPIAVEEMKEGGKPIYVVRKGHHRVHAAWLLRKEDPNFKVKALVVKPGTTYQRELEQWASNNVGNGSELEQGNQLWALKESKDLTYAQVAERLGIVKEENGQWVPDVQFVQNRIKLAKNAGGTLTKAIKAGVISYTTGLALVSIAKKSENPELTQEVQVEQIRQAQELIETGTSTLKEVQEIAKESGEKVPTQGELTNPESEVFLSLPEPTQEALVEATQQLIAGQATIEETKKIIPGWESAVTQAQKDYPKYASLIRDLGEAIEEELPGALVLWSNTRMGTELWNNLSESLQKECEAFWLAVEPQKTPRVKGKKPVVPITPTQGIQSGGEDKSIDKETERLLKEFSACLDSSKLTKEDIVGNIKKSELVRVVGYYAILAYLGVPGFNNVFFSKK